MYSEYEVSLKDVFLSEIGIIIDEEDKEDVCKNGCKDCCDSEMKLLCSDCYWDKVQDSVDSMEALK